MATITGNVSTYFLMPLSQAQRLILQDIQMEKSLHRIIFKITPGTLAKVFDLKQLIGAGRNLSLLNL